MHLPFTSKFEIPCSLFDIPDLTPVPIKINLFTATGIPFAYLHICPFAYMPVCPFAYLPIHFCRFIASCCTSVENAAIGLLLLVACCMTILQIATAIMIVACLLGKLAMHQYLDYRHKKRTSLQIASLPLLVLQPYQDTVAYQYRNVRYATNSLLTLAGLALLMNGIVTLFIWLE